MAKANKGSGSFWVVKSSSEGYWAGVGGWVDQLRKAKLYSSWKMADAAGSAGVADVNKRYGKDLTYEVIEVTITASNEAKRCSTCKCSAGDVCLNPLGLLGPIRPTDGCSRWENNNADRVEISTVQ